MSFEAFQARALAAGRFRFWTCYSVCTQYWYWHGIAAAVVCGQGVIEIQGYYKIEYVLEY